MIVPEGPLSIAAHHVQREQNNRFQRGPLADEQVPLAVRDRLREADVENVNGREVAAPQEAREKA